MDQEMVKALYFALERSNYENCRGPQNRYQKEILKVQEIKNKDPTLYEIPPALSVKYVFA